MNFLRLYCLRHGETVDSANYIFNGWRDVELTSEGRRQLDEAASALKGLKIDAVYSSDLQRAVYGGEALAKTANLELIIEPEFREVNFGLCEGLRFREIKERFPDLADDIVRPDGGEFLFPEGEGAQVFRARIEKALDAVRRRHPTGVVAVVSHAGVGRAILANALNLTNTEMWTLTQDFACLNVIDFHQDGGIRVKLMNGYLGPKGYHQEGPGFDRLAENVL
ncbi:MAG: histidine phosphatase family protein [Deltaproteobacteria bacterium]|jgi:broad specificity phosphatase PhoE|nr:histidine phosphatase family protein [Deltaproteobacteria bacterium]